jgi:hypothetical protein
MPPLGLPLKGKAWKLKESLCGQKQSALKWYETWTSVMLSLGLKPSDADPCLFVGGELRIGLYVDHALIFGYAIAVEKMVTATSKQLEIKNLSLLKAGDTFKFLGMELHRTLQPRLGLVLSQQRYVDIVLDRFGMKDCKPVSSPMVPGVELEHDGEPLGDEKSEYVAIVGSLLYLAAKTRPDIAHAVSVLSRFMSCPRATYLQAAKQVLRNIAQNPGAGMCFKGLTIDSSPRPPFTVNSS